MISNLHSTPMAKSPKNNHSHPATKESSALTTRREQFVGPLPHPDLLKKYEEVSPGVVKILIELAKEQAKHRQELEKKIITANITNEKVGMYLAFTITIAAMGSGIYLLMNNKETIGFIAFFAPALFQAGNYVYTRYYHQKQRKQKKHI